MSVPFIGRHAELRSLDALMSSARREHLPCAALIVGEPGSGKSRLLREVVGGIDPRRAVLVAGFEPTQPVALAAVGGLFRLLATVPEHGRRLEVLAFGSVDDAGQGAVAVFEAAHRAHAAFGPLTVAVDDLQWVDAQSLALLHYLVSAAESTRHPLAVIAAARPSPSAATFASGIGGPIPEARRVSIDLRGLPLAEGMALVLAIDGGFDARQAEELWRRAAGSPFWLEALARARGAPAATDPLAERLRALSADGASLINALAVGARPFAREVLGAIIGWPDERLSHAVRELAGRGLAIDEHGAIRLSHDLVRESVAGVLPATTARSLHERIAETFERLAGDDIQVLAEALDHRVAAHLPAARLAAQLVASPQRRLLGEEQLRRLSLLADEIEAGSVEQHDLDRGIGRLAAELGESTLAHRHWSRAAGAARDPLLRQQAHIAAARAAIDAGSSADAHAHVDRARSIAGAPFTTIELDALEARTGLELDNDITSATILAERAVASGRELAATPGGATMLPAEARAALLEAALVAANAAWADERTEDLAPLIDASLEIADGLGDEARIQALAAASWAFSQIGLLARAEALSRSALDVSDRLLLPLSKYEAAHGLVRVLCGLGRLAEARSMARELELIEARIHPAPFGDLAKLLTGVVELALDEPGALARIVDLAPRVDQHIRISWHGTVAAWLARRDAARAAADVEWQLTAARSASDAVRCPRCAGELLIVSVEALARIGRLQDARRGLAAWEADLHGPGHLARELRQRQAHAAIAMASGSDDADAQLDRLAAAYVSSGRLLDAAWARLDLGRVLSGSGDRAGDRTEAIEAFSAAATLARRAGAVGVERLATQALRKLGVRAWKRGPGVGAGARDPLGVLSSREREIAGLVAGGATNAEVAASLAISPKTVERHVTNILAKVGARNRTELATRLGTAGTGFPR